MNIYSKRTNKKIVCVRSFHSIINYMYVMCTIMYKKLNGYATAGTIDKPFLKCVDFFNTQIC